MEIHILGPLEASEDGQALDLGPPKQRALLALLVLHRNQVVSADRLIDELWAGRPPAAAAKSIQVYVSQLRKNLGADAIESRAGGYKLNLGADVDRFENLAEEGRDLLQRGQSRRAADVLREALLLWRGPPLADVAYESFAQGEIARLEELRLSTLEERIDADLAGGRDGELVPELQRLVRDNPLRERLRAQVMLALYRTGRQAEALEAYRDARRMLKDELGLEPSRELQQLEQAILRQDEALGSATRPRSRLLPAARRGYALGVAALVAAVGAAALAVGLTRGGGGVSVAPESLAVVDPATNRIVGDVQLHSIPNSVAVGGGSVWVTSTQDRTLFRVDAKQRTIVKTIALPGAPANVAFGAGAVWLPYLVRASGAADPFAGDGAVLRVDPRYGYSEKTIATGEGFSNTFDDAIAATSKDVWVVDPPGVVTRIDAASSAVAGKWQFASATAVAAADGAAWVLAGGGLERIPATRGSQPVTISLGSSVSGPSPAAQAIAVGPGAVWTANALPDASCTDGECPQAPGNVFRIDPSANIVEATIGGRFRSPLGAAYGGGSLWVIDDRSLFRIDPAKNTVTARISLAEQPVGVAAGEGGVWVAVGAEK